MHYLPLSNGQGLDGLRVVSTELRGRADSAIDWCYWTSKLMPEYGNEFVMSLVVLDDGIARVKHSQRRAGKHSKV
jgi:hypothetical protein